MDNDDDKGGGDNDDDGSDEDHNGGCDNDDNSSDGDDNGGNGGDGGYGDTATSVSIDTDNNQLKAAMDNGRGRPRGGGRVHDRRRPWFPAATSL